jgi:hypothetical protein
MLKVKSKQTDLNLCEMSDTWLFQKSNFCDFIPATIYYNGGN